MPTFFIQEESANINGLVCYTLDEQKVLPWYCTPMQRPIQDDIRSTDLCNKVNILQRESK